MIKHVFKLKRREDWRWVRNFNNTRWLIKPSPECELYVDHFGGKIMTIPGSRSMDGKVDVMVVIPEHNIAKFSLLFPGRELRVAEIHKSKLYPIPS